MDGSRLKKLVVAGALAGGVIYAGWKGVHHVQLWNHQDESNVIDKFGVSSTKQEHYSRVQMTCFMAVKSLMPPVKTIIMSCLSTESLKSQLQETTIQSEKVDLWENLKIISFARAVVSACAIGILIVVVRIQFSVIAAFLFTDREGISESIQRQYFSTIHQLLQNRVSILAELVQSCSKNVLVQYTLKHKVTMNDVREMILQILDNVWSDPKSRFHLVHPLQSCPKEQDHDTTLTMNGKVQQLLQATTDMLDIEDSQRIIEELAERIIYEKSRILGDAFHSAAQTAASIPMAKVIPIVSDNADYLLEVQNQNSFIKEMTNKDELMNLSRNCYEAFSER